MRFKIEMRKDLIENQSCCIEMDFFYIISNEMRWVLFELMKIFSKATLIAQKKSGASREKKRRNSAFLLERCHVTMKQESRDVDRDYRRFDSTTSWIKDPTDQ